MSHLPNKKRLTVEERLDIALNHLVGEDPSSRVSFSALCRAAKVSRANVYENHRSYVSKVDAINAKCVSANAVRHAGKRSLNEIIKESQTLVEDLKRQNRSLLVACLELRIRLSESEQEILRLRNNEKRALKSRRQ